MISDLRNLRKVVDECDEAIAKNLSLRLDLVRCIAAVKMSIGGKVLNQNREDEVLQRVSENSSEKNVEYVLEIYKRILDQSREIQQDILDNK